MRVLFLTHRLPYAPNRGDRIRAFHIVRTLAPRVQLEVVSLAHDEDEAAEAERLRALGVGVAVFQTPRLKNYASAVVQLGGTRPLTHILLDAPGLTPALARLVRERPPDARHGCCPQSLRRR